MGYGGTQHATVHVDLVTADVEAIVDGICGAGDDTLSDVEGRLSDVDGRLYDGSTSAVEWLQYIQWDTSDADSYLSNIEGYLYEDGYSAAEWLEQIEYDTYEMADDLDSIEFYLYDDYENKSAVEYLRDIYEILYDVWDDSSDALRTTAV